MSIIVTGASSGVGASLARLLAGKGHRLFITGRNEAALQAVVDDCKRLGAASVHVGVGDVSKSQDVDAIWSQWGSPSVDALVANAGLNRLAAIEDFTEDEFDTILGTNLKGVWLWMRRVIPSMKAAGHGQIVVTSSVLGLRPPQGTGASLYTASKYAVQGLVGAARNELAGTGIKVATVNPAGIATPWWEDPARGGKREKPADTSSMLPPEAVAEAIAGILFQHALSDVDHVLIDNVKLKKGP